jgi:hypothetical protein
MEILGGVHSRTRARSRFPLSLQISATVDPNVERKTCNFTSIREPRRREETSKRRESPRSRQAQDELNHLDRAPSPPIADRETLN